jgi:Uma2 family endonuclease
MRSRDPVTVRKAGSMITTETMNKKLFTVDEFYRMGEVGILPEDQRFELIRGEIIEMPPPGPPHSGRVNRLVRLFTSKLGDAVIVSVQNPFLIDRYSLPMPDLALLKPQSDFYQTEHPHPGDVMLLVEISHTTSVYDANVKAPLYAECSAPESWQLDLKKDVLIVRTNPKDGEYHTVRILRRGETITPQTLPDFTFSVDEILG